MVEVAQQRNAEAIAGILTMDHTSSLMLWSHSPDMYLFWPMKSLYEEETVFFFSSPWKDFWASVIVEAPLTVIIV